MSAFDPYHKWLGISPQHQPPNYYRLLSLDLYESDPEVIDAAVDRIVAFLQDVATGAQAKDSQKLLNEIAVARLCLLDDTQKLAYDQKLKLELAQAICPPEGASVPVQEPPIPPAFAINVNPPPVAKPAVIRRPAANRLTISTDARPEPAARPSNLNKQRKHQASPSLLLSYVSGGVLLIAAIGFAFFGGSSESKRRAAEEARIRERQESFAEMGRQAESMIPDFEANFDAGLSEPAKNADKKRRKGKQN